MRVCIIEDENQQQQRMIDDLQEAVRELQRQVEELMNRPSGGSRIN